MKKSFEYKGAVISYEVEGEGKPLVLLHGFAEDKTVWHKQVPVLRQHAKLIVPDLPGSGASSMLQGEAISMNDYANCIKALLDSEQVERCIMLGHSMGGYITLAFAEMYPEKLYAFGFVQSTAYADSAEKKISRAKGIEAILRYGAYAFIKNTTPNLFAAQFKAQHSEEMEALIEKGKTFSNEALQQYYAAMMNRPDRTAVLRGSKVPVLFIIGTEDVAAPVADVLPQTYLSDVTYVHIIKDVGHMAMWEAACEVNEILVAFIEDVLKTVA